MRQEHKCSWRSFISVDITVTSSLLTSYLYLVVCKLLIAVRSSAMNYVYERYTSFLSKLITVQVIEGEWRIRQLSTWHLPRMYHLENC